MAIAAGVVRLFLVSAGFALINMPTECGGAAANQIPDDAMLFKRNPAELVAMSPEDIRDFNGPLLETRRFRKTALPVKKRNPYACSGN